MCSGLSMQLCIFEDNGPLPKGECEYSKVECSKASEIFVAQSQKRLIELVGKFRA